MRPATLLLLALVPLLHGCQSAVTGPLPTPVRVEVPSAVQVSPQGSPVPFTVTNVSQAVVMITMCGETVAAGTEAHGGLAWDPDSRRGLACTAELYNGALPLAPGETWTGAVFVDDRGILRVLVIADGQLRESAPIKVSLGPA